MAGKIIQEIKNVRDLSYKQYELTVERFRMSEFVGEGKTIYYDETPKGLEDLTNEELEKFYNFDDHDEAISFHDACSKKSKMFIAEVNDKIEQLVEFLQNEESLASLLKTTIAFIIFGAIFVLTCILISNNFVPTYLLVIFFICFASLGCFFHQIKCYIWAYLIATCRKFLVAETAVTQEVFSIFLEKINSNKK